MSGWIEERLGLRAVRAALLDKPVGPHVGWSQTLGAIALFLFLLQAATGVVLAFYYVPSPDEAYATVNAVENEVPLGWLLRGLHRWGASLMVLAVLLHLGRAFLHGAYKAPREATWMAGVLLLVVTLAFGFTGYLLPWDQRAYWATVVGQWIIASVPVVGGLLVRALGGLEVGGATLSRFFVLHVLLLPAAAVALVAVHLYLVQRHGVAGPARDSPGAPRPFYPFHAVKDLAACVAVFVALLGLAATLGAPLEEVADPTDTTYLPKPEWYFLFLYELLKFFKGPAMVVGTALVPLAGLALLFLLPLLDGSPERRSLHRPVALAGGVCLAAGLVYLTIVAAASTPRPGVFLAPPGPLRPSLLAGMVLYEEKGCASCHSILGQGMKLAPDLYRVGARRDAEWLSTLLRDPASVVPSPSMVRYALAPEDLRALVAYLTALDLTKGARQVPRAVVAGGRAIHRGGCLDCHRAGGEGQAGGRPLEQASRKADAEGLAGYLRPGGPGHPPIPSPLAEEEVASVVAYLRSL
jgi:ubiquinol-cytochrome c reductase cytochrome b subunit